MNNMSMKIGLTIIGALIGIAITPSSTTVEYVPATEYETITETVTETRYVCVMPAEPKIEYIPDTEDVEYLAKTMWGEARGCNKTEQAAVAWCVLNRLDAGYADTVKGVCTAAGHFTGYHASNPVTDELAELAADVLTRHYAEQNGEENAGRVLPSDYLWFTGSNGRNWFRNEFKTNVYWDWSLPSPYEEE